MVWGKGPHGGRGVKAHMGINQEAYDAEYAATVRALDLEAERQRRWRRLDRVTIFIDAQAAIARMKSCEVGPGQQYALGTRAGGLRSPQRNRTATELNGSGTKPPPPPRFCEFLNNQSCSQESDKRR